MLDAIKWAGSIAGLVALGFTLFDRLVRDRPLVKLTAKMLSGSPQYYIEVENPSRGDLLLRKINAKPPAKVAVEESIEAVARAAAGYQVSGLVRSGQSRTFPLLDVRIDDTPSPISFKIVWRKADSTWLWQWPLRRSYTRDDVLLIGEGAKPQRQFKVW